MNTKERLDALKERLRPARRSKPGRALYYEHPSAQRAHDLIKETRSALRNAAEEAGTGFDAGGSVLNTGGGEAWARAQIKAIESKLQDAGL